MRRHRNSFCSYQNFSLSKWSDWIILSCMVLTFSRWRWVTPKSWEVSFVIILFFMVFSQVSLL